MKFQKPKTKTKRYSTKRSRMKHKLILILFTLSVVIWITNWVLFNEWQPLEPIVAHETKIVRVPIIIEPQHLVDGVITEVTMYNTVPEQTDSSPCISASGDDICKLIEAGTNICAANKYPLGTRLYIEGLGNCIVLDRMNARFKSRIDWCADKDISRAINFGLQKLEVWKIK